MTCPSGLHGAVLCFCPAPIFKTPERRVYEAARTLRQFFHDVTAESVIRDYEYRQVTPKFWTGWRYERGHRCEDGQIHAGSGSCTVCY